VPRYTAIGQCDANIPLFMLLCTSAAIIRAAQGLVKAADSVPEIPAEQQASADGYQGTCGIGVTAWFG